MLKSRPTDRFKANWSIENIIRCDDIFIIHSFILTCLNTNTITPNWNNFKPNIWKDNYATKSLVPTLCAAAIASAFCLHVLHQYNIKSQIIYHPSTGFSLSNQIIFRRCRDYGKQGLHQYHRIYFRWIFHQRIPSTLNKFLVNITHLS